MDAARLRHHPFQVSTAVHVSGTADCALRTSTFLRGETPDLNGTVFARPHGSASAERAFNDAFSGNATIHYAAIASHPWTRSFDTTLQDTATSPGGGPVETAKVVIKSLVKFERVAASTLQQSPPPKRDKIADLLINEGFGDLRTQAPAGGPPVGAAGDPDTVVIPGFGAGDVGIDVNGTVLNGTRETTLRRLPAGSCSPPPASMWPAVGRRCA